MNSKAHPIRNTAALTAVLAVSVMLCEPGQSKSYAAQPGSPSPSPQTTVSPRSILGTWRCEGSYLGSPTTVIATYKAGNYRTVIAYAGQQIIVGGTYNAIPSGPNSLSVTYNPSSWLPRQICNGPGGVGGDCVKVNFYKSTDELLFQSPNSIQAPLGSCSRVK